MILHSSVCLVGAGELNWHGLVFSQVLVKIKQVCWMALGCGVIRLHFIKSLQVRKMSVHSVSLIEAAIGKIY